MSKRSIVGIGGALAAVAGTTVLVGGLLVSRDATAVALPEGPQMPGMYSILGGDGRVSIFRAFPQDVVCTIRIHTGARQISFEWKQSLGYQLGDDPNSQHHESYATWYWPNYAEWISSEELFVAGVSPRDGRTVAEVWQFEFPQGSPKPLPISGGGQGNYWLLPERTSIDLVLDEAGPDHQVVTFAKENLGRPGDMILRFQSSGMVYGLDLASGALSAIAAPDPGEAPLHVPELAHPGPWQVGGSAVEHQFEGFVYSIMTHIYQAPNLQRVILLDGDRDGTVESVELSDPSGYYHGDDVVETF